MKKKNYKDVVDVEHHSARCFGKVKRVSALFYPPVIAILTILLIGFTACNKDDEPIVTKNFVRFSGIGYDVLSAGLSDGKDVYNSGGNSLSYSLQIDVDKTKGYYVRLNFLLPSVANSEIADGTYNLVWRENTNNDYQTNTVDYYFLSLWDYFTVESETNDGSYGTMKITKQGKIYEFTYDISANEGGYFRGYYKGKVYRLGG